MTKSELRARLQERDKVAETLRRELLEVGRLASEGLRLAHLWERDRPLAHRGGCSCHFCMEARKIVRMHAEAGIASRRKA
jgi:hypothetical protein